MYKLVGVVPDLEQVTVWSRRFIIPVQARHPLHNLDTVALVPRGNSLLAHAQTMNHTYNRPNNIDRMTPSVLVGRDLIFVLLQPANIVREEIQGGLSIKLFT